MTRGGDSIQEQLLREMVRIRRVEEAIADRYSEEKMRCPVHLSIGQEAPAAAFSLVAKPRDYAVSTHRAHAHFLAKGGSVSSLIAELHGKGTGCSRGAGGSMHLADKGQGFMGSSAIVGNSIPVGVGLAMSLSLKSEDFRSWVFLGDAATEEGVYYESMNFAVLRSLPVIFMCENNDYSVYTDSSARRPEKQTIAGVASSLGADSRFVNGNDAVECYEAVTWAREHSKARPVFLEFKTFRQREHCGPNLDDRLGYRPEDYVLRGFKDDPIVRLKDALDREDRLAWLDKFELEVRREIEEAFSLADSAAYLTFDEAARLVYA